MFSERTRSRLQDIVDDADRIERFLAGMDANAFIADERTAFAVERLLQRVTEAVIHIGDADMERVGPAIPAGKIRAFGNLLRHEYRDVDMRVIYTVAREDVPILAHAAARALAS